MEELVTYLRLTPEFGGTRFGPFEALETRLGTNSERCHVTLAENLGVLPEHARLIRQRDNSLILTPADRTATIFLWKPGARRPNQINTPTAVRAGDAFSLVTPDGPRFVIELDALPPEVIAQREESKKVATHRRRLSAASMANEGKRQLWTRLLVLGPAQLAQRAYVFVVSGAIYQPRNIFLAATILGGWIFGGAAMCRSSRQGTTITKITTEVQSCQQELAFAQSLGDDSTQFKFPQLAKTITDSNRLGAALEDDAALRDEVKKLARGIFLNPKPYDWLVHPKKNAKASDFATWSKMVNDNGNLDEDTKKLVIWLGADGEELRSDFVEREDSTGVTVCARGVARITYRQAIQLGMDAQPDGLVLSGDYMAINDDKAAREDLLRKTISAAGGTDLPENYESAVDPIRQGVSGCVFLEGDDDRKENNRVLRALVKTVGNDAPMLPPDTTPWAAPARIAKFWSADIPGNDLRAKGAGVDFSLAPVSSVLDALEGRGKWILRRTAETIAKAVVVPCLASLKGDRKEVETVLGEGKVPSPINCLVLDWKLRNEEQ